MSNRIAFFADGTDLTELFDLQFSGDAIFEPHYNIARGQHIPVITRKTDSFEINRMRWGKELDDKSPELEASTPEDLKKLEAAATNRSILPISGFYIWKNEKKKDHPFFVRKIDNTLLFVAGYVFSDKKKDFSYTEMALKESNTLIQPISDLMPLLLKPEAAKEWLRGEIGAGDLHKKAEKQFLITDLTVHRVTKELKDLSKNEKSLIQPIPK